MGSENCDEYCKNACRLPMGMPPPTTCTAPTTAISTYDAFSSSIMHGIMMPPKKRARHPVRYMFSLRSSKSASAASSPPNAFTTAKPWYVSSTCALSEPAGPVSSFATSRPPGTMMQASSVSSGLMVSIMTNTPTNSTTLVTNITRPSCRFSAMLSTSFVATDMRSPVARPSRYEMGTRAIFSFKR